MYRAIGDVKCLVSVPPVLHTELVVFFKIVGSEECSCNRLSH